MTFRRSLYFSIAFHFLIFGSAIAFAQFARGALWGRSGVIIVSLVGSGVGAPGSGEKGTRHRIRDTGSSSPEKARELTSSASSAPAAPERSQDLKALASAVAVGRESNSAHTGELETDWGPAGGGAGAKFGMIPPEKWAIIESALERSKTYPRMARERGIEGVARVRFRLRSSGDVETVEIVKSSGSDILDTASVRTVYRAAPLPYVNGWVEVPIAYVLK